MATPDYLRLVEKLEIPPGSASGVDVLAEEETGWCAAGVRAKASLGGQGDLLSEDLAPNFSIGTEERSGRSDEATE
jgi:hypothetical protein